MITLTNITDSIQIVLSDDIASSELSCVVSYRDTTTSSIVPQNQLISTSGTTPVNLVDSPSASTQRLVEYISVFNSDRNGSEVTISFSDNGTLYTLHKCILEVGDKLEYSHKIGFRVISNTGSPKTSINYGSSTLIAPGINTVSLDKDLTVSSYATTPQRAYGFGFPTNTSKYYHFKYSIFFNVDATTTGNKWNINFPTWSSLRCINMWQSLTSSTFTWTSGISISTTPTTANATSAATLGNFTHIEGIIFSETNDFIDLYFSAEVASPAYLTLKAGSFLMYNEVY